MKNFTIIIVVLVALGIAYLFLKDRKDKINFAGAVLSDKTAIPLPLLPGTDIPVGLKPRPGNGIYQPLPMSMPALPEWDSIKGWIGGLGGSRIAPKLFGKLRI